MGFDAQVADVLSRASIRREIMAQLAGRTWGLELSVPRSTHSALITSLVRYGLSVVGSFAYKRLINWLETQVANFAAWRIAGVSRVAKLERLRPVADMLSARNLYIQQSALLLDCSVRADDSPPQWRAGAFLSRRYELGTWDTQGRPVEVPAEIGVRRGARSMQGFDVRGEWLAAVLADPVSTVEPDPSVESIYCTVAAPIRAHPGLSWQTFDFSRGETGWGWDYGFSGKSGGGQIAQGRRRDT